MTSARQRNWQNDWTEFVLDVANDFGQGLTAAQVTDKYCDQPVEWIGTVSVIHSGDYPAVKMSMPPVEVALADGRHGTVDYLSLLVSPNQVERWQSIIPGQRIKFQTSIRKGFGPFVGLNWADVEDKLGYISIGTNPSLPLEVINNG